MSHFFYIFSVPNFRGIPKRLLDVDRLPMVSSACFLPVTFSKILACTLLSSYSSLWHCLSAIQKYMCSIKKLPICLELILASWVLLDCTFNSLNFLPEQYFSNVTIQFQWVIWLDASTQTVPNYRVPLELNLYITCVFFPSIYELLHMDTHLPSETTIKLLHSYAKGVNILRAT